MGAAADPPERGHSEPEPDLALLERRDDLYAARLPEPPNVLLVVEIAESSLVADRPAKLPLYARAGVPAVWLVDLAAARIEVFRDPREGAFSRRVADRDGTLSVSRRPGLTLSATDVLG